MKNFLRNTDINLLAAHSAVHQLAGSVAGTFITAFLLRTTLAPSMIFLTVAAILILRFTLRPLMLFAMPRLGARRTIIIGTVLFGLQYPVVASVHGVGLELLAYAATAALAEVFYWPSYHILFAARGEVEHRGSQLGAAQMLATIVAVLGPAAGGIILATVGPWPAFGAGTSIEMLAAIPLLKIRDLTVVNVKPTDAYASAIPTVLLIFTNGWIGGGSEFAWAIISFRAFGERYDTYGAMLTGAALAGTLGGMMLGRLIDAGGGRRAARLNATVCIVVLLLKTLCGTQPASVAAVAVISALFGGLYAPSVTTAFYNAAAASPYHLRFQIAVEAAFDLGGFLACIFAVVVCVLAVPLQVVILMAVPAILLQARLLDDHYAAQQPA